jgi:hypothetical protein
MATKQAKSTVLASPHRTTLVRLHDGARTRMKVDGKTLMWCAIGLGAAIVIPVFIYFAPHFL